MKLLEKVAVVTGGGRGIGRAVAQRFAAEGAAVIVAARTATELEDTVKLLEVYGPGIAIPTDVSDPEQVRALFLRTIDKFGRIDILVNAAAVQGPIGPLWQCDVKQWRAALDINLLGTMYCCHFAIPYMVDAGVGRIVNFSGGGATAARPNFSAYAAAKAAVVRLTETLAAELQPHRIAVNAIAPGLVNTRLLDAIIDAGASAGAEASLARGARQDDGSTIPATLPAELALFLATVDASQLTGRLISAVHDDWRNWQENGFGELAARPWFTLRRLDRHTLTLLLEEPAEKV